MKRTDNKNRSRIVGVRFTPEEYVKMQRGFRATTCRKMSQYLRDYLMNRPITTNYRNESLDEFMLEIIGLRTALNAMGNNFNQMVKKLHTLDRIPEFAQWIRDSEQERKKLLEQVACIKDCMEQITRKWLQS